MNPSNQESLKQYLGDGVYAEIGEHGMIKLSAENGLPDHDQVIYLDPDVFRALVSYEAWVARKLNQQPG